MKTINGDLIKLAFQGKFDIIIHGCNCHNIMNGGIAKQIKEICPEAFEADSKSKVGDHNKLGRLTLAQISRENHTFIIINAYTQFDTYTALDNTGRLVNYGAVRKAFKTISKIVHDSRSSNLKIGYPMIGAGLAGGDWNIISKIIDEELNGLNHTLVIWNG